MYTIPNLITSLNLLAGAMATVMAVRGELQNAFWCVALAAVFDFLDGLAARLLKQYSRIGVQLDSLADMVSFGLAPAAVAFTMWQASGGVGLWCYLAFVLAVFSALRLARFNIDESQTTEFVGMPTPAMALFVVSAGYVFDTGTISLAQWTIPAGVAVLCFLMVCPLRMFSLKFSGTGNALRIVFLVLALAAVAVFGVAAIPGVIAAYVAISAVRALIRKN